MANRETPWGIEKNLNLNVSTNTAQNPYYVYPIDGDAPAVANTGIVRGGVTNLYENVDTAPPAQSLAGIHPCSNGKLVAVDTNGSIYTGTTADSMQCIGKSILPPYWFKRKRLDGYIDAIPSSNGTSVLALRIGGAGGIFIDELSIPSFAVINTVQAIGATSAWTRAVFARANNVLFSKYTTTNDTGILAVAGNAVYWIANGSSYATGYSAETSSTIQAFSIGNMSTGAWLGATGTQIIKASPTAPTTWTSVQYSGVSGLTMGSLQNVGTAQTTLKLGVVGQVPVGTGSIINWIIDVTSTGTVTTSTGYGIMYKAVGGTEATFTPVQPYQYSLTGTGSGNVTCLGSAGIWNVGANYGTYGYGYNPYPGSGGWTSSALTNSVATLSPRQLPDLVVRCGQSASGIVVTARSFNATMSLLCAQYLDSGFPVTINDFGGGGVAGLDIDSGCSISNILNGGMFIPPTVSTDSDACTYRTSSGIPVVVWFGALSNTAWPNNDFTYNEISKGVVSVNSVGPVGSIIDTNTNLFYDNCAAYCNAFHTNLSVATNVANFKTFNIYSSQLDEGLMYTDASFTNWKFYDWSSVKNRSGVACYGSITNTNGAYTGDYLGDYPSNIFNKAHAGTYVFNQNVPPAADADFQNGIGIVMLSGSAIQTPNYFGYILGSASGSNLLPQKFTSIFMLHGSVYAYDGDAVYYIMLSNATSGVASAAPIKVAVCRGLDYLAVSTSKAYFKSSFDNSLWAFDGSRSVVRIGMFNEKQKIRDAVFNQRDANLVMRMSDNLTTGSVMYVRDEDSPQDMFDQPVVTGFTTEMAYPQGWTFPAFSMSSTSDGVYYVNGTSVVNRSFYDNGGTPLSLKWQSGYHGITDGGCIEVSRIVTRIQFPAGINDGGATTVPVTYTWNVILSDGTNSMYSTTVVPTVSADKTAWYSFQPGNNTANCVAGSLEISLPAGYQYTILKAFLYYTPGMEITLPAINQATS